MNKFPRMFFAVTASSATVATMLSVVFLFSPVRTEAYATGPVTPSASSSSLASTSNGFDLAGSLKGLISPFTSFFNSIQTTGNTISIAAGNATSGVTVTVDATPYINQFDTWFYGFTGVNIQVYTTAIHHFFVWLFGALGGIVTWVTSSLKGSVK